MPAEKDMADDEGGRKVNVDLNPYIAYLPLTAEKYKKIGGLITFSTYCKFCNDEQDHSLHVSQDNKLYVECHHCDKRVAVGYKVLGFYKSFCNVCGRETLFVNYEKCGRFYARCIGCTRKIIYKKEKSTLKDEECAVLLSIAILSEAKEVPTTQAIAYFLRENVDTVRNILVKLEKKGLVRSVSAFGIKGLVKEGSVTKKKDKVYRLTADIKEIIDSHKEIIDWASKLLGIKDKEGLINHIKSVAIKIEIQRGNLSNY